MSDAEYWARAWAEAIRVAIEHGLTFDEAPPPLVIPPEYADPEPAAAPADYRAALDEWLAIEAEALGLPPGLLRLGELPPDQLS